MNVHVYFQRQLRTFLKVLYIIWLVSCASVFILGKKQKAVVEYYGDLSVAVSYRLCRIFCFDKAVTKTAFQGSFCDIPVAL